MHEVDHFADAINMKYHQIQGMDKCNLQTTITTTTSVDRSNDMYNLLVKCAKLVAAKKKSSGYVLSDDRY